MSSGTSISHTSHNVITSFPVEHTNRPKSMVTSERMGAFSEMRHTPSPHNNINSPRLRVDMSSSNSTPTAAETPILPSSSMSHNPPYNPFPRGSQSYTSSRSIPLRGVGVGSNRSSANSQRPLINNRNPVRFETKPAHVQVDPRTETLYIPNVANSQADSSDSRRKYDKLSDVYSQSGDTAEFAKNLGDYINEKIPYQVSIAVLSCFCILAFLLIIFGILNLPFCAIQPMIPIWLIIEGFLFIISATFRIYFLIPTPRRTAHRRRQRRLGGNILCKGIECLFALANIVWLILGCVWVYGSQSYVHFEEGMFERHYCEPTVYWSAFFACTAFLIFYCLIIVILIGLLIVGTCKEENNNDEQNLD